MISRVEIRGEMVVTDEDFQRLLTSIPALSHAQLDALASAIRGRDSVASTEPSAASASSGGAGEPTKICVPKHADGRAAITDIEARFAADPHCPHCQGQSLTKWGSANGLRRYLCKPCDVTFNALTGTPLAQLHKREVWLGHAGAVVDGLSLRKTAGRLDVHLSTAFRWRHRFLKAPKAVKAKVLDGTVEADETYFLHSEKGSRKLERPARKRGGKAKKRGLSDEQVPVLIARDRNKAMTDQVLADRSEKSIAAVLEPIIARSAVLVSDGAGAYRAFADRLRIPHVALNLSEGEHRWGVYHIQNVNSYDSRLKTWMRRFNGVATKYLDSYLGWHRTKDREGDQLNASRLLIAAWG